MFLTKKVYYFKITLLHDQDQQKYTDDNSNIQIFQVHPDFNYKSIFL